MQNQKRILAALFALTLCPLARADVHEAAHDVKEATVHAAKRTGELARDAGHGIGQAAKAVAHDVASKAREGYYATKRAVHKESQ
ncbi:hypothetical protein P3W85_21130 [Cupriavidus basilensis]|uniref:Uncharacterized protein n=1 Tax=Cupriavidus basilensis TaxID=68895 RepID=A0ABT6AS33_9BURK|nr:hypothetical protein [Cupriavidus basilensis]MDF3835440.1 hypothetical protein [Cupriavidus basilensis]